jgi:hypothetical protein
MVAMIEAHWLALSMAAIIATSCVALVALVRNCPTFDDTEL